METLLFFLTIAIILSLIKTPSSPKEEKNYDVIYKKDLKEPEPKIDITNHRETKPTIGAVMASYDAKRKSTWKAPMKKADVINYEEYINSPEWLENSARISKLVTTGGKCEACGAIKAAHVHHITYTNLGKETMDTLAVLCRTCHEYTHKMAGKGAGYYPPLQCPTTKG